MVDACTRAGPLLREGSRWAFSLQALLPPCRSMRTLRDSNSSQLPRHARWQSRITALTCLWPLQGACAHGQLPEVLAGPDVGSADGRILACTVSIAALGAHLSPLTA